MNLEPGERVKVIFRKFHNGEVIALFPAIPADGCAEHCLSYQHVGQHGAASVDLSHCTVPTTPAEYAALAEELRSIGYVLTIRQRITHVEHKARLLARVP